MKFSLQDNSSCFFGSSTLPPRNLSLLFQKSFNLPQPLHCLINVSNCPFIHLLLKIRQNVIPDTVSHVRITFIGLIYTKGNPLFFQIFLNLTTLHCKKRTNHIPIYRTYAAKPFQTCSASHIHQKCLCIVILMMRKRNFSSSISLQGFHKGFPAHFTPRLLQRLFPFFCN